MPRTARFLGPLAAAVSLVFDAAAAPLELRSPDGRLRLACDLDADGAPAYQVSWNGRPVIVESPLGLELEGAALTRDLEVARQSRTTHDSTWKPVWGERAEIRDHYHELTVEFRQRGEPHRTLGLTFRAYDAGVAFCYRLPDEAGSPPLVIRRETSVFRFPADHPAWATYQAQGLYQKVPLSTLKPGCERPLVVELAEDLYAAVGEARLVDYARMKFGPLPGGGPGVVSQLDGPVSAPRPLRTPWRFILVTDRPGGLLENNPLVLNLNDPCALSDTSWIQPGKVLREVSLSTDGGKACIDFAVRRGLQYIEYDAGWYGYEYDDQSDATGVNLDPRRSQGPLDLHEVIRYGRERGIGVLLYVNRRALERQLDALLPLYRSWGIRGIKFGFVNVGPQAWTTWLHEAIRKCAAHRLMVDVHDEYRPTGYSRTYPNLMTAEGIRGDETRPTNGLTLAIAFTRLIVAPADHTVCWTDPRVRANSSHAFQLAKPLCLYSPWQFLFWYDRPAAVEETPELEFYRHLPMTWDETRVLQGRIGEYLVTARRKGDEWFLGFMNSHRARALSVPLDFLPSARSYDAVLYLDDPTLPTPTQVRIDRRRVDRGSALELQAGPQGGMAVHLKPRP